MPNESGAHSDELINNPLSLARAYEAGLQMGLWGTIRKSVSGLRNAGFAVSYSLLQCALEFSKLPAPVLILFDDIPPTNAAAQVIIKTKRRDGLERLIQRANNSNQGDRRSIDALLEMLSGEQRLSVGRPSKRLADHELPLLIALRYHEEMKSGRWTLKKEVALELGTTPESLALAIKIAEIPSELLAIFRPSELSLAVGRRLLLLLNSVGVERLIILAKAVPISERPLSKKAAFAVLGGGIGSQRFSTLISDRILDIASRYEDGRRAGLWETRAQADVSLGVPRDRVAFSVRVSKLPTSVLKLFMRDEITFLVGKKLLGIDKSIGRRRLLENARIASRVTPSPHPNAVLDWLSGICVADENDWKTVKVELRRSANGENYLHVSSPEILLLAMHTDGIANWCSALLHREIMRTTTDAD